MADTIFQKIIDGEIPCHKVYEDDHVLAFLDINPLSKGHTLVIPRRHVASLFDLGRPEVSACMTLLQKLICPHGLFPVLKLGYGRMIED